MVAAAAVKKRYARSVLVCVEALHSFVSSSETRNQNYETKINIIVFKL